MFASLSRRNSHYEPLLEEHDVYKARYNGIRRKIAIFSLLLVTCALMGGPRPSSLRQEQWDLSLPQSIVGKSSSSHEHTLPTRLSVVDPETGKYINALTNPLYDLLKGATYLKGRRRLRSTWLETPTLSLDKTLLKLRESLTLSWNPGRRDASGNTVVQDHDVVTLHCPADSDDFVEAATIAQVRATSHKHGGLHLGQYSWLIPEFPILREASCQFRVFAHDRTDNTLELLAESPVLRMPAASRTPTGIHLAYSSDPTEMVVQFITGESGKPVAMFGKNGTGLATKVEGTSHTYTASDMCGAPANQTEPGKFIDPGSLHVIRISGLEYNQTYSYKVGLASGQGIVWSDVYNFMSAPRVGDGREFSYVVYGDQGCPSVGWGDGGLWTAAMAAREAGIAAVHHFGDLSYARGVAHIWDDWFHMIEAFTTSVPLMIGVGNHEYDYFLEGGAVGKDPSGDVTDGGFHPEWGNMMNDSGNECGVPTANRFTMPASNTSNGVFWYSHDYGTLHTIVISSEHNLTEGSPQYTWLEADLKTVNRTVTPWLIVESHRPLYESEAFWDNAIVGIAMRYEIEDLLLQYQVDLFLAGHYHAYLRTCDGLYQSLCNNGGPTHITVGSAGAFLDEDSDLYDQEWTAKFISQQFGYGRITIANESALHWEFVAAGAENDTDAGTVKDDVWIIRQR